MTPFVEQRQIYDRAGRRWWLDPRQEIDKTIINHSTWEPTSTEAVRRLVRPGDVAVDAGANIGWYTLLLSSLVGPDGLVLAFEPTEAAGVLSRHLELNDVRNVQLHTCALGSGPGQLAEPVCYSWPPGIAAPAAEGAAMRPLDGFCLPRCDLLKLDTDGYEMEILEGSKETLRRFGPAILLEVCEYTLRRVHGVSRDAPYGQECREMLRCLREIGYSFASVEGAALKVEEILESTDLMGRSVNIICRRVKEQ